MLDGFDSWQDARNPNPSAPLARSARLGAPGRVRRRFGGLRGPLRGHGPPRTLGRTPFYRLKTRDVGVSCTINQGVQSSLASPRGRTRPCVARTEGWQKGLRPYRARKGAFQWARGRHDPRLHQKPSHARPLSRRTRSGIAVTSPEHLGRPRAEFDTVRLTPGPTPRGLRRQPIGPMKPSPHGPFAP